jgi:chromosome segregation protein
VGPNGCGKTNVVDAINWVLGEQSAYALRGSRMEDVIFNGTDNRKALGMAEVSLTLCNDGNSLPVEYSEVMVTRRVFRSGESEYFINKAPCRLKDINELFMDTGIGTKAYSIIMQGKLDLILSSKPEDRRFLFEEASGIMKVKMRKKEAMRKLESTEQNLLRVNDIISEIKKQIGSLQRQVGKAKRYKKLSEQVKEFETTLALNEYRSLRENWKNCEEELEKVRKVVESSGLDVDKDEDSVREKRRALAEAEAQLASVWEETRGVSERIIQSEHKVILHNDRIKGCNFREENARAEIGILKDKLSSTVDELSTLEEKKKELEDEGKEKREELDEGEKILAELAEEMKRREKGLVKTKDRIVEFASLLARKRSELASLEAVDKSYRAREERLKGEKVNIQQDKEVCKNEFAKVTGVWGKKKDEIGVMEKELRKLENRITDCRKNIDKLREKLHSERGELSSKKSNLELIEGMTRNYEGYSRGVRTVMSVRDSLGGICGVVGDLLKCPKNLEVAIETVLGHKAQYVVVESTEFAEKAIHHLRDKNGGRAAFVLLDLVKTAHMHGSNVDFSSNHGVIGAALEKVSFAPRYGDMLHQLLGRVLIVDNLENAWKLTSKMPEGWQVVTLEGEVIGAEGLISGGSVPHKGVGLIGRNERINELKGLIQKFTESIKWLEDDEKKVTLELNNCLADEEMIEEKLHREKGEFANIESTRTRLQTELERLEKDFSLIEDEIVVVGKDKERSGIEVRELSSEIDSILKEQEGYNEEMHSVQQYLEDGVKEREKTLAGLTEAKITLAGLEEREESLKTSFHLRQKARSEYEEDIKKHTEGIETAGEQVKEFESEIVGIEKELEELAGKKRESEVNSSKIGEEKKKITAEIEEMESALGERRKVLEERKAEMHTFDVKSAEYRMEINSLNEKMFSRYQLVLETLAEERDVEEVDTQIISEEAVRLRAKLEAMGPVNLVAIEEYKELEERYNFLCEQRDDLLSAKESLHKTIGKINQTSRSMFMDTFRMINENFGKIFKDLFGGGKAEIFLVDEKDVLESGIEIIARPPGKKLQSISLLSGGEKAMTAIALLFSIMKVKPSPFCVLDEIDAPLDDANIGRFAELVKDFTRDSQFIIITHNKTTISTSDIIYGITMEERGVSKKIGVKFTGEGSSTGVTPAIEGAGKEESSLK